jgi:hypothetical protein
LNRGGQWDLVLTADGRELRAHSPGAMGETDARDWAAQVWRLEHPVGPLVVDLDCDGPLSHYVRAAETFLYKTFPQLREVWTPDPDVWDLRANLPGGGLHSDYAIELNRESERAGFVLGLDVVDGAREGVAGLLARPDLVELHVVTTSWTGAPYWPGEREAWLGEKLGVPARAVTFTAHKHRLVGDVLVDDKYETLVRWKAHHRRGVAILWRASWNRPYWATAEECLFCRRPAPECEHAVETRRGPSFTVGERDPAILAVDGWAELLPLLLSLAEAHR